MQTRLFEGKGQRHHAASMEVVSHGVRRQFAISGADRKISRLGPNATTVAGEVQVSFDIKMDSRSSKFLKV